MDPITRKSYKKILFKSGVAALLEQSRIDRDNGKVLCPKMDEVVNIYSQILIDYQGPVDRGATQ